MFSSPIGWKSQVKFFRISGVFAEKRRGRNNRKQTWNDCVRVVKHHLSRKKPPDPKKLILKNLRSSSCTHFRRANASSFAATVKLKK